MAGTLRLKRLSHVSLGTPDLPRAIAFYEGLLGANIAHRFVNPQGALYGAFLHCNGGTFVELFNDPAPKPPGGAFRHLCFEVDDIEATAAALRAAGHEAAVRRGRTDGILQFFIHDPDGNQIEFQQHDGQSKLAEFVLKA